MNVVSSTALKQIINCRLHIFIWSGCSLEEAHHECMMVINVVSLTVNLLLWRLIKCWLNTIVSLGQMEKIIGGMVLGRSPFRNYLEEGDQKRRDFRRSLNLSVCYSESTVMSWLFHIQTWGKPKHTIFLFTSLHTQESHFPHALCIVLQLWFQTWDFTSSSTGSYNRHVDENFFAHWFL